MVEVKSVKNTFLTADQAWEESYKNDKGCRKNFDPVKAGQLISKIKMGIWKAANNGEYITSVDLFSIPLTGKFYEYSHEEVSYVKNYFEKLGYKVKINFFSKEIKISWDKE